jgi:alpha-1,2-rhamnosyltransferase
MSERQNRERDQDRERIRLLEFQLDHLLRRTPASTHERYRLIYSVSGHIYRFLGRSKLSSPTPRMLVSPLFAAVAAGARSTSAPDAPARRARRCLRAGCSST